MLLTCYFLRVGRGCGDGVWSMEILASYGEISPPFISIQTAKYTYLVKKMFGASINYSIELIPSTY